MNRQLQIKTQDNIVGQISKLRHETNDMKKQSQDND